MLCFVGVLTHHTAKAQLLNELLKIVEPTLDKKGKKDILFGNIRGIVCDYETSELVSNTRILLTGTPFETYTNSDGMYEILEVPDGEYELVFVHKDYMKKKMRPITILGNADLAMRVTLDKAERGTEDELDAENYTLKDEAERFANMMNRKNANTKKLMKLTKYTGGKSVSEAINPNNASEFFSLNDEIKVVLDSLASFLKKHTEAKLTLATYSINPNLSSDIVQRNTLQRAQLMSNYLMVKHAIDKNKITTESLGKQIPHEVKDGVHYEKHHLVVRLK